MSKSAFVRSLQEERVALSPFEVSQRLRLQYSCVSTYQGDPELKVSDYRGYMMRYPQKSKPTPTNPELYVCIISLDQPKSMQDLVWTKEIIQILDRAEHRTKNKSALGHMIDMRAVNVPHPEGTPANVKADKDGFILALGCAVPHAYREILRREKFLDKYTPVALESLLSVPAEYIPTVLQQSFEEAFEEKLAHCDV